MIVTPKDGIAKRMLTRIMGRVIGATPLYFFTYGKAETKVVFVY